MIALGLVAILTAAAIPYLYDSFASGEGDRISTLITERANTVRTQSIREGKDSRLAIRTNTFDGIPMPAGWSLQIRGLNDSAFHAPERDRTWTINSAGICEPLSISILGGGRRIELSFDPMTGQVLPDDHD